MSDEGCKNTNIFRVRDKEYGGYSEDQMNFFMAPDGELFWMDEGGLHKADPEQYEIVIERPAIDLEARDRHQKMRMELQMLKQILDTLEQMDPFVRNQSTMQARQQYTARCRQVRNWIAAIQKQLLYETGEAF